MSQQALTPNGIQVTTHWTPAGEAVASVLHTDGRVLRVCGRRMVAATPWAEQANVLHELERWIRWETAGRRT